MKIRLIVGTVGTVLLLGGVWLIAAQTPAQPVPGKIPSLPQRSATSTIATTATTHTMGLPSASPSIITVNAPTIVTVTVQITDSTVVPTSVNLLRLNGTGATPTILGQLHDDGNNGDLVAGDSVYSIRLNLNEPANGQLQLQVSAAFRGLLTRVLSAPITIPVWPLFSQSPIGIQISYPPTLNVFQPTIDTVEFDSSPNPLFVSGGKLPDNVNPDAFSTEGFSIGVQKIGLSGPGPFSLDAWLAINRPYSQLDQRQSLTVSGLPGTLVTFRDEVNAGSPLVFVPKGASLYIISYLSSFDSESPEEQAGLQTFRLMLTSLVIQ